jgi:hypothetical protein
MQKTVSRGASITVSVGTGSETGNVTISWGNQ